MASATPSLAATRRSSCTRLSCSLAQSAAASTAKQHHSIGNHRQLPTFTDPGDNPGDRQNVSATMTRRSAAPSRAVIVSVTVGTAIASCPPYRSVRAELPHTAPTLDEWRRNARWGKDAGCEDGVSIVQRSVCALPSAGSAEVLPSLFVSFIGTMAQSESSKTYMPGSWVFHLPGPVCSRRRSGGLPVLVHIVC